MHTIFQSNANDLDASLIDSIKALFKDKEIEITVAEIDETEFLLRSPANREALLRAVDDIEAGRNIVIPDQEPFQ